VFGVDRAGLVGQDGETHHGIFDVAYLTSVPKMTVYSPASFAELEDMMKKAVLEIDGPVAVRYPRGGEGEYKDGGTDSVRILRDGTDLTIITYGITVNDVLKAADILEKKGISTAVVKLGVIAPLDNDKILPYIEKTGKVIICEETSGNGCIGQKILSQACIAGINAKGALINTGTGFITHGDVNKLREICGLHPEGIADTGERMVNRE
jgi:1-deoxy-D-xylulose-5-phosphate synthase